MRNPRRIADIISAIYAKRYRLTPKKPVVWQDDHQSSGVGGGFLEEGRDFLIKHIILVLVLAAITLKLILVYHYYNRLVFEFANVSASYSNMSVQVQRRNDIGRNLIQAIHYYSEYEERVYSKIVSLRTAPLNSEEKKEPALVDSVTQNLSPEEKAEALAALASGVSVGAGLMASAPKLMALAEQYPDLKSELNYTVLLSALVDLEKDLAAQRVKFNADVNTYSTTISQFPSNIFAKLFGFDVFPYFDSSQEAKEFKIVE